ncbi:MAG TPA: 23S rRNA (guanosine(2251)-2'-O)-methyltransferase RlmB [Ignavibacteria bacterium]|nr:23S rRNA (guanosine(2251)-2'-O)-methyltransferase RlmB [Ignavibacteria bacterium]
MKKIYGRKPVLEAIKSGQEIEQILIPFGSKGNFYNELKVEAKKNKIKIAELPTHKFQQLEKGNNTQGVIANITEFNFSSVEEIITSSKEKQYPLILLLDSIQDPQNLGAILRSAECFGVDGVLITTHQSSPITETVEKTSAGAINHLKIAKVTNLVQEMKFLKENGFWIVGSTLENSQVYTSVDYKIPIALIMGNEEKGIRKLVADNCDFLVHIPMKGKIQSLNVSVAAGILLAEISNNRK